MMPIRDPQPTEAFEWTQEPWGRALRCRRLPAPHLFTSRDLVLCDDPAEWAAAASSLGVTLDRLRLVRQVHKAEVAVVRRGEAPPPDRPEADIILTDDPSVAVGVRVADCAPVLIVDPVRRVVAAVHAGWRGTARQAASTAVQAMSDSFGCRPGDLVAAIGPCLGRCCGEVGPDVVAAFTAGGAGAASLAAWFAQGRGDRAFLDLARANADQLDAAGLPRTSIFASELCTKTHHTRLHSYRAEGAAAGRLLAAIRLAG